MFVGMWCWAWLVLGRVRVAGARRVRRQLSRRRCGWRGACVAWAGCVCNVVRGSGGDWLRAAVARARLLCLAGAPDCSLARRPAARLPAPFSALLGRRHALTRFAAWRLARRACFCLCGALCCVGGGCPNGSARRWPPALALRVVRRRWAQGVFGRVKFPAESACGPGRDRRSAWVHAAGLRQASARPAQRKFSENGLCPSSLNLDSGQRNRAPVAHLLRVVRGRDDYRRPHTGRAPPA